MGIFAPTLAAALLVGATAAWGGMIDKEGAGPDNLQGVVWHWVGSRHHDDTGIDVSDPDRYTLSLGPGGTLRVRADCNRVGGGYQREGDRLTVQLGPSTLALCPPESLDGAYLEGLAAVESWELRGGGRVLILGSPGGTMEFERGGD